MKFKICSRCKREFPLTSEYFYSNKCSKDAFRSECKCCGKSYKSSYMKTYYEEKKIDILDHKKQYYIDNKEELKQRTLRYYSTNKTEILQRAKVRYSNNKQHLKIKNKQYQNKQYKADYRKIWYQQNKERVNGYWHKRRTLLHELPYSLTSEQWKLVKNNFKNLCAYCNKSLPLEKEHVVPISKGGGYTIDNIIPACKSCNCSKNNSDMEDWYKQQPFFSEERLQNIYKWTGVKK